MIKAILAVGENGEIGQNGDMPWMRGLPKDLEYFKEVTLGQRVVMGRKTFDSLPFEYGLPDRDNLVLTTGISEHRTLGYEVIKEDCNFCTSKHSKKHLETSLKFDITEKDTFIIGGASVYEKFWNHVDEVHITRVKHSFPEADTFFEPDLTGFEKVGVDKDVSGEYSAFVEVWRRIP